MTGLSFIGELLNYGTAVFGAFLAALWLSLIFWTYRDIRSRSQDRWIRIFATLLVALLTLPGILIYLVIRPSDTLDEIYMKSIEEEALLSQIEDRPVCPGCGGRVHPDWMVCANCHTRLRKRCHNCDSLLELPWQLCPFCATPVPESTATSSNTGVSVNDFST